MARALIGLGANLGEREHSIEQALRELDATEQVRVVRVSSLRVTRPVGGPPDQPAYVNAAATLDVEFSPNQLWRTLAGIEHRLGRERTTRWGARTIDLDLLLFEDVVSTAPELTIPHPRLATRRFVLEPAAEIASDMSHPTFGWTIGRLFEHLVHAPPKVLIVGGESAKAIVERLRDEPTARGEWEIRGSRVDDLSSSFADSPKLTILVSDESTEDAARRRRLEARRDGPYLIVAGRDESRAWDEVTAALAGMA